MLPKIGAGKCLLVELSHNRLQDPAVLLRVFCEVAFERPVGNNRFRLEVSMSEGGRHYGRKPMNRHNDDSPKVPKLIKRKYGRFLFDRLSGWILDSVIGMVLFALGVTSILQAVFYRFLAFIPDDPILLALVAGATFLSILGVLHTARRRRPILPQPPGDYRIETLNIQMEYVSRERAIYSRSFRLKILTDGIDRFRDTFHWTGSEVKSMGSSDPFHTVAITDQASFYSFYEVSFNQEYNEGDTIDFTIVWELEDDNHDARPFVARQINRPEKSLGFFVKLYSGAHGRNAIAQIAVSASDRANAHQVEIPFDDDGVISWTIRKPLLGYYYELRWSGPDWT